MKIRILAANYFRDITDTREFGLRFNSETRRLDFNLRKFYSISSSIDSRIEDLLFIAAIVYAADRILPRSEGFDAWTREIEITIPVKNPKFWEDCAELPNALNFLSGDVWKLAFKQLKGAYHKEQHARHVAPPLTALEIQKVSLFSGGLDSTSGVLNLLSNNDSDGILAVGHYDISAAAPHHQQALIAEQIRAKYSSRFHLLQFRSGVKPSAGESTLRTRSFLFLSLGAAACNSLGDNIPLIVPENGMIALNVPLTPSRIGSCSTRTAHPIFLALYRKLLGALGYTFELLNPFSELTKGEVVSSCGDPKLLKRVLSFSNSCARPSHRISWTNRKASECGRCMPCIYRRAALYGIGLDDGADYGNDVLSEAINSKGAWKDVRACIDFLNRTRDTNYLRDCIRRTYPQSFIEENSNFNLVGRGLDEVRTLFKTRHSLLRSIVR